MLNSIFFLPATIATLNNSDNCRHDNAYAYPRPANEPSTPATFDEFDSDFTPPDDFQDDTFSDDELFDMMQLIPPDVTRRLLLEALAEL